MRRLFAVSSLAALALVACTGGPSGSDPIKIGMISALTGDAAAIGADQLSAVQMAIAEINAAGGVGGRPLQLIPEDGKCAAAEAASAAQKLVSVDKVVAIIGGLCSGETLAAAPIVEAAKIVMISPSSSSPDVTEAGDFIFRNYPSDSGKTKAIAKYFADEGFKHVAMISENTDYAQALRASLKKDLPSGAVVFDETVDPGTKDFRSLFTRLKSTDFDVFFSNPNGDAVNAVVVQQYRQQGFTQPIAGADTMDSVSIAQIAGEAAEGVMVVDVPTAGEGTSFETAFHEQYGEPKASIAWVAYPYDVVHILAQAFQAVGTDGPAVRDYLYAMAPYSGVVGTFHFDGNGDPVGISYVLKTFKDGKIVTVRPLPTN
jgi:branched-chain amino acid transport system substrate-binding protein